MDGFTLAHFFPLGNLEIRTSGYDQGSFVTSAKA
jgi:hypothetical protein